MDEVFPVLAGVVLALLLGIASRSRRAATRGWERGRRRAGQLGVSGELAVSWLYVLIDTVQVLVAALLTSVLVRALRRTWRAS